MVVVIRLAWYPSIDLVFLLLLSQGTSILVVIVTYIVECILVCILKIVRPILKLGKKMLMLVFIGLWSTHTFKSTLIRRQAMKLKLLEPGDAVVAIQGWRGGLGNSNTLRVVSL